MTVRVVLLAEGSGETGGVLTMPPSPGDALTDDMLGPAHALVARALAKTWNVPERAVRFEAPNRTVRGTIVRGGELLDRGTLRRVLLWARPTQRPDLAVVLVDADGTHDRRARLAEYTADLPGRRVIGVAVQEFEAWLLADEAALRDVLGGDIPSTAGPEALPPGEAKARLNALCDDRCPDDDRKAHRREARRKLCENAALDALAKACPSFGAFLDDLRAAR